MISQSVEYALRAVVMLAQHPQTALTASEIAAKTKAPLAYLSKILQGLTKAGVVTSRRGVGGGVMLVKSPAKLTLLEVVNAVDPIPRIKTCPLDLPAHGVKLCPLHKRLDKALATVEAAFAGTTLAEVLSESHGSIPLCNESNRRRPLAMR